MIKQIIPANNWFAVMLKTEPPYWFLVNIACWALEVEGDQTTIDGYAGRDSLFCPAYCDNFYIYIYGGDINDSTKKKWEIEGETYHIKGSFP